ncbi:MAG: metal ABC transporter permease [Chloroflexi bacterium]|nr:metal ABC transporter permease [Chloroflexota bacterium]MDA1145096.1 metal ABC transporter permease [Chloroflexota bacterium]
MIDWILDPYQFEFMRRALLVLLVVSVVGGVVGTFVVHKGLAFSGDALAHSTLAGVAIAFVNGANVSLGALIAAVATALGIGWTQRRGRVSYDTAIGILFVAMFSLGILVISRRTSYTPDLFSFVFGNILGVSQSDLLGALLLGAATLAFVAAFRRELSMVAYDPSMAATVGVPVRFFQYALLVLIAVAVVVALKAIGIVLVNAMLIVPAATASLVARRIEQIMVLAVALGATSSVVGLHLSFHANVATSPAIVLVACAAFAVTLAATARRRVAPTAAIPHAAADGRDA